MFYLLIQQERVKQEEETQVEWYLGQLLKKYIVSSNPHLRQVSLDGLLGYSYRN